MKGFAVRRGWSLLIVALWLGLLSACGPRPGGYPYSELDTPEQHVFNGFAFVKKERMKDAQREFEQALLLDPNCSPAFRGIGVVYGMKGDFPRAFDAMGQAEAHGKGPLERALADVGMMSLYRMERSEGWLSRAEKSFALAVSRDKEVPEAYLELGMAYLDASRFGAAEEAFKKVLQINTRLVYEAGEALNLLKKIEEAAPRSTLGKELVLVKGITRGDLAVLMVRETDFVQRLSRKIGQGPESREKTQGPAVPPDVVNHPMKNDVMAVLRLNLQGLSTTYDGSFGVDQAVTRAALATVMADVMAREAEKPELYQKYTGADSPFLDVTGNSPHFRSIMICSEWAGVMGARSGYFHPMEKISGIDALLVLRKAERKVKGE